MKIRFVPQPKAVPQSSMQGIGGFSSMIMGAFGYVRGHHIKTCSVRVELMNGTVLASVGLPSREWVCDTAGGKSTGGIDLPSVGSLVFVLFPYGSGNVAGAFVLASFFDSDNAKHKEFLVEGDEAKVKTIYEGGIRTTYDRETAAFTVEDVDDAKLSLRIDKGAKEIELKDWHDNHILFAADGVVVEGQGNKVELVAGKAVINGNLEVLQ